MEFNNNTVQQQQMTGGSSSVPTPQQQAGSPMTNQQQASQMERLYQQMRQGNTQGAPTTMQQGSSYAPQQQQQQAQQPQPVPQQQKADPMRARDRVQNNQQPVDNGGVGNDDNNNGGKAKMSPKTILIAVGLGIAVIVVMLIFSQLNNAANEENNPSQSVDEFGNPIDPNNPDGDLVFIEPNETPFMYEFDQVEALRAAGYTGPEIEENEKNEVPYEDLIKQAEDARQAWIDEAVAPLYDTASDEYKQSVSGTWLGLPVREDLADFETTGSYYEETKNLDYEKVEPRGHQLYIKIYLSDDNHDDYFFLNVEPSDYLKLKDSGNVVVTYRYVAAVTYNDEAGVFEENTDQNFIVSATLMIYE